jgi:hypothetical protein
MNPISKIYGTDKNLLFNQIMKVDIFSKIVLPDSRGGIVRKSLE